MGASLGEKVKTKEIKLVLYGAEANRLEREVARHKNLSLVKDTPDLVVCYGGDGTLLAAEIDWPGLPKVPILNSKRGRRCIPHSPEEVFARLADGSLLVNEYTKLLCEVYRRQGEVPNQVFTPLNEVNVHMGRINSAVRFQLWFNGKPYENGLEILGDGFVVCTPFGSTAYFGKLTRGAFTQGIGIAFKSTSEHTNHVVAPEDVEMRILITRGPAVLAYDCSTEYVDLEEGDELLVRKHKQGASILTCGPVTRLNEPF